VAIFFSLYLLRTLHDDALILFACTVYKTQQDLTVLKSQNQRWFTSGCFYIPRTAYTVCPTHYQTRHFFNS